MTSHRALGCSPGTCHLPRDYLTGILNLSFQPLPSWIVPEYLSCLPETGGSGSRLVTLYGVVQHRAQWGEEVWNGEHVTTYGSILTENSPSPVVVHELDDS